MSFSWNDAILHYYILYLGERTKSGLVPVRSRPLGSHWPSSCCRRWGRPPAGPGCRRAPCPVTRGRPTPHCRPSPPLWLPPPATSNNCLLVAVATQGTSGKIRNSLGLDLTVWTKSSKPLFPATSNNCLLVALATQETSGKISKISKTLMLEFAVWRCKAKSSTSLQTHCFATLGPIVLSFSIAWWTLTVRLRLRINKCLLEKNSWNPAGGHLAWRYF